APIVAGDVAAPEHPGQTFHVLGIDPFVDAEMRPYLGRDEPREARAREMLSRIAELVTRSGAALMARPTARDLGLSVGDRLTIVAGGSRHTLTLVGLLDPADPASARSLDSLLVTDIATAQEIFGAVGRLTRIDLGIDDNTGGGALLARITSVLPPGVVLVDAGSLVGNTE